jgi:hypothetical protein
LAAFFFGLGIKQKSRINAVTLSLLVRTVAKSLPFGRPFVLGSSGTDACAPFRIDMISSIRLTRTTAQADFSCSVPEFLGPEVGSRNSHLCLAFPLELSDDDRRTVKHISTDEYTTAKSPSNFEKIALLWICGGYYLVPYCA